MNDHESSATDVRRAIDREVDLVRGAVDLVASGGAPSTLVVGLRLTQAVIAIVEPDATRLGVVIEPIWGPDETTGDVRVSRIERP